MGLRAASAVCTSTAQENCTEPPPPPKQPLVPPTCTAVPRLPETRRHAHGQGPTAEGEWKQGPRRALCPLQQECTRRPPLMSLLVIVHRPGKTGPGAIFSLRAGPWDRRSASAWAQRPWLTGQRIGRPPLQSSEAFTRHDGLHIVAEHGEQGQSAARTGGLGASAAQSAAARTVSWRPVLLKPRPPALVVWRPVLLKPLPP